LALRHAIVARQIAVGAYVTEATGYKLACDRGCLIRAMLEQQPAATLEVVGRGFNDGAQIRHRIGSRCERYLGFKPQGGR
jgi:hypothetical protein